MGRTLGHTPLGIFAGFQVLDSDLFFGFLFLVSHCPIFKLYHYRLTILNCRLRRFGASQLLQGRCLFVAAFELKHHSSYMPVVLMPLQEL